MGFGSSRVSLLVLLIRLDEPLHTRPTLLNHPSGCPLEGALNGRAGTRGMSELDEALVTFPNAGVEMACLSFLAVKLSPKFTSLTSSDGRSPTRVVIVVGRTFVSITVETCGGDPGMIVRLVAAKTCRGGTRTAETWASVSVCSTALVKVGVPLVRRATEAV